MAKKTYLAAVLQGNCPRCREGQIFSHAAYNLSKFNKMNNECPHCGVRLEPEPGFYQGAMYVGYAITIACMVAVGFTLFVFFGDPSEWIYVFTVIAIMILIVPLNYRYSRILYLYFFGGIKYKPELSN